MDSVANYAFQLEFDGRRTYSVGQEQGKTQMIINGSDVQRAIQEFGKKCHLSLENVDALSASCYRAFFNEKAFFRKGKEMVYYIEEVH